MQVRGADTGGDRDDKWLLFLDHRRKLRGDGFQDLRFNGQYQDIGTPGNRAVVGVSGESEKLFHGLALAGVGIGQQDL